MQSCSLLPRAVANVHKQCTATHGTLKYNVPVIICVMLLFYGFRRMACWDLGRTNSPTSARRGDGLGHIRIWATPPKRLVFWDGAPSPSMVSELYPELNRVCG